MNWEVKTNLVLEWIEEREEEIEHAGVDHEWLLPFLAPPRRKQRHAADAVQRHQLSPIRVGPAGHVDAGEGNIDGGADTVRDEAPEGGGVGLAAEAPRLRQERRRRHERRKHLTRLKPATD